MKDPIVDRSPAQKLLRLEKLRAELFDLGYSVVKTTWLHSVFSEFDRRGATA